ncbi:hypothetical protein [Streptomyces noursei]|uniref:hypothetical protein n=1 Tax=Streptomyces noursei TaxID=1971 RepID=UPI0011AFBE47|nr:hypothetical protein [Streptomyces noursei]
MNLQRARSVVLELNAGAGGTHAVGGLHGFLGGANGRVRERQPQADYRPVTAELVRWLSSRNSWTRSSGSLVSTASQVR